MGDPLYDKDGLDPELDALEQELSTFRFDRPPPELPAKVRPLAVAREASAPRLVDGPRASLSLLRGRLPLAAGLMLAMLSGVVSFSAIKKKEADVRKGWNLVPVVVSAVDLSEGTVVTMEMVSQRAIPEQFVTSSVVKPDSASYVIGQKVLVALQAGDPLLWSQFETTRASERLSTKVQKKARAVTLAVNGESAVGGWVRPNDHIDLIGSFKDPQSNEPVAVTLMQNLIVLATGKITGTTNINLIPEGQRAYNNVSVLVVPEEAEILVLAQDLGKLTMTLRNDDDLDVMEERGRATIGTLMSGERTRVLQQKRYNTIQVIRGAQGSQAPTPDPGK